MENMNKSDDPLIAVDDLDPEVIFEFQVKANPKLKSYKSSILLAVKKFKEDFEGGHFRLSEMSEKLYDYIDKAVEETISSVIDGLVAKGLIQVRQKSGKDVLSLSKSVKKLNLE